MKNDNKKKQNMTFYSTHFFPSQALPNLLLWIDYRLLQVLSLAYCIALLGQGQAEGIKINDEK